MPKEGQSTFSQSNTHARACAHTHTHFTHVLLSVSHSSVHTHARTLTTVLISQAKWRNYGCGELIIDGEKRTVAHPGEVWVRYSNNVAEIPQRIDLRKNATKKSMYKGIATLLIVVVPLPRVSLSLLNC
jgi:hypothetical protein